MAEAITIKRSRKIGFKKETPAAGEGEAAPLGLSSSALARNALLAPGAPQQADRLRPAPTACASSA